MRFSWPIIVLACLLAVQPVFGSYTAFLFIEGIEGESTETGREGWIAIDSFAQQVASVGGGRGHLSEIVLIKEVDKASPKLYQRSANGQVAPKAIIDFVREDGGAVRFYRLFLKDVSVTGASVAGDTGGPPVEAIGLDFSYIEWAYAEFDSTGRKVDDHIAYWDLLKEDGGIIESPPGGFRFRATLSLDGTSPGQALLSWNAEEGRTYGVYYSPSPDLPFTTLVDTVSSDRTGTLSIVVDMAGDRGFFIVREID
jgi:type VI secretion system secreted protein Hcp